MGGTRPRIVAISEAIQLLLLCEPLWRAIELGSAISVTGTSVVSVVAVVIILQATRRRKVWARDLLAGLATLSVLWLLVQIVLSYFSEQVATQLELLPVTERFILASNLVAVALLFASQAMEWFGDRASQTRSDKRKPTSNTARTTIVCPNCSQQIRVPTGRSGGIECPPCGHRFTCCTVHNQADATAETERAKALDPALSPDAKAAREAMQSAEFSRDRHCKRDIRRSPQRST
jgi:hypothetical protein